MTNETETRLRLSVWRPARLDGTCLHVTASASSRERYAILDTSTVLEQIYVWVPSPYDPALSWSPTVAERVAGRLLRLFGEDFSPAERPVGRFQQAVSDLLADPEVQAGTCWSDSEDTVTDGDTELNLRVNATLGVLRHMLWISRVYADVPDASVLIR